MVSVVVWDQHEGLGVSYTAPTPRPPQAPAPTTTAAPGLAPVAKLHDVTGDGPS